MNAVCLLFAFCFSQEGEVATFGTTVVMSSGFRGEVYDIEEGATSLPKFKKLHPVGAVYTNSLNIEPREFREGFPGVTKRFEWFAIDYKARFYVGAPGKYRFGLLSDDGSKLYIDDKQIIDNDGVHGPQAMDGSVKLTGGIHRIRVSYFQGPRFHLALVLAVWPPAADGYRVFNTNDFKPPVNPEDWKYGSPADLEDKPKPNARPNK